MSDLEHRLRHTLEPLLALPDPRQRISAYHDMPYAIFRYDPEEEFTLRQQVTLLETRLSQKGKRVRRISLADCLDTAMRLQRPLAEWFAVEREIGTSTVIETVHAVLSEGDPSLVDLVASQLPAEGSPPMAGRGRVAGRIGDHQTAAQRIRSPDERTPRPG